MPKATTTINFADGDQVTSLKLDEIISGFALGTDSADGTTVTISGAGVISVGTVAEGNIGTGAVTTAKLGDGASTAVKLATNAVETAKIKDGAVTTVKIADDQISFVKTLPADRAVQADMQSATAAHFVSPDVMKYHPGVAKAYGRVAHSSGSATVTGGYGVTSAADTGTGRQITLSAAMANTSYTVVATASTGGTPIIVEIDSTTKFTLSGGSEASGRLIHFTVYGQLA